MTNSATAPKLRTGTELDLDFTDLAANGQAVGRADGLVVFCFGPLPRERARVRITAVKPAYAVAELVELQSTSSERVQPFCDVFGLCGGCQAQHLAYRAQLKWKREMLRETLARIGGIGGAEVAEMIGMNDPRAYRNKMSLVVERRGSGTVVGFYRQRTHDVVPIVECPIVMSRLDEYIGILARADRNDVLAEPLSETRHVVARASRTTGEAVVSLTTARRSPAVATAAPSLLQQLPGAVGVFNSFDLSSANAVIGRRNHLLTGSPEIEERIEGLRYRVSAASFFQINVEIVAKIFTYLQERVSMLRSSNHTIVDLYCGTGTFSLFFASQGYAVYGIEENSQATAEAEANARLNDLQNVARFQTGRVEELVRSPRGREALARADLVFLDPPRKGSDEATLGAIAAQNVPVVWYLSCDPATLARDLKFLVSKGYALESVQPFDMFPQTGHVESLVTLSLSSQAERTQ